MTRPQKETKLEHATRRTCVRCIPYHNAVQLKTYPFEAMVKIGDAASDMEEGLNAGTWKVGLMATGNTIGMVETDFKVLSPAVQDERLSAGRKTVLEGGPHYVVSGLDEINRVLDQIDARLAHGERP